MSADRRRPGSRVSYETRIFLLALAVGLPALLLLGAVLWAGDHSAAFAFTMLGVVIVAWLVLANLLRNEVVYHLRTLSNLLEALRMADYSMRGRREARNDALGEVVWEVNRLSDALRNQRLEAREVSALLRKVMSEVDIGLFTFDGQHVLRLVNPAGERLLGRPAAESIGEPAVALGLDDLLAGPERRTVEREFANRASRWDVRVLRFREGGLPHYLLVVTDLSRALREEERVAWQRLIRVIGHEINNSLAPIKSMATTLEQTVRRDPLPADWQQDVSYGLGIIGGRADALARLMSAYAMLARMPAPKKRPVDLAGLAERVVQLEQRLAVETDGEAMMAEVDPDQLEQVLINLIKNAADATGAGGNVRVRWNRRAEEVFIEVEDDGPGVANPDNLFVPFFTTKPGGTGVGLVLCRQIAEAHGGHLTLDNRTDGPGCVARLKLPVS